MSGNNHPEFHEPGISLVEELSAKLIGLNLELDRKNRQLEESEAARMRMLSNISHDLRAPLSAVRGAVDRLTEGSPGAAEREQLAGIISRRVAVLEKLVDDLFFAVRLDQPEFALRLEELPIEPFIEEYYITMETAGSFSRHKPALRLPGDPGLIVRLDAAYFLRVLDNLMSNALRHTAEGGLIELAVNGAGEAVEIFLRDSGDGIVPEALPHIFDRTFTASRARTPGGGAGLGLHIAKSIVEKHGGRIACESRVGEGSTFRVTLPRAGFPGR
jgi:signal transduction histidine kinase